MLDFIYNTPTKVYFGREKEREIGKILCEYGAKKVMIQFGKGSVVKSGLLQRVEGCLTDSGISYVEFGGVEPNPKLDKILEAIEIAKKEGVDFLLAIGGGSVLDSCKFTAIGVKSEGDIWDFCMGKAKPQDALPVCCILTISAAGSEMSNSAVLTNTKVNVKKGLTTELNRCKFAIMNPELTFSLGKYQTACGIVDMMSHTIERYFTVCPDTPLTDSLAESLLRSIIDAGKVVMENPNDYEARATLMWGSSLAHNGLTGCGRESGMVVHQLGHAMCGKHDRIAHGASLALLLPAWAKFVYKKAVPRFARFARAVWGVTESDDLIAAEKGITAMEEYFNFLQMPTRLNQLQVDESDIEEMALLCTYNRTRTIKSFITIGFEEAKQIYKLSI